ncbi:DUF2513 domain-containing protein [Brevundimonas sp.]|uniref:DUF2513 domain-containing protein n=1 Tax=Brevundimonas sp. TaxID=1871086 RepID=UPI0025BB1927|nr:DUF2513 domain-containing protein [Brevundimonas sp.]
MDFIRDILLRIEEAKGPNMVALLDKDASESDLEKLQYHLALVIEAGLAKGIAAHTMGGKNWLNLNLTWDGHEFVDAVRDPEIWRQTKAGAAKVGAFSLDLLASLAKGLIRKQIEKHTGVELDLG